VSCPRLERAFAQEFAQLFTALDKGANEIVLDFSEVDYCDSSGYGALMICRRRVTARGGKMRICGMRPPVEKTFRLMRLDLLFPVHSDWHEAITAIHSSSRAVDATPAVVSVPAH